MLLWQGNSTYDTEADKNRLRNIWHDNKQDIDFWKKLCIIKQENTQDNKQDGMLRGEKLWHTCLLSKWKSVFQYIPIESQIEKFQDEYYNAIAKCHINGDSNVFIEFMLKQIDKILEEILLRADEQDEHVTEYVKKLLNVMEYEVPYTSTVLMEKLGLKSKETFRKNYMNPAMELQLVQMTIPEKPKSRNQRYIRR